MIEIIPFIQAAGYLGIAVVVFTESGLLIGMFLPGDSLLFTAGFLASQGYLHILPLAVTAFIGAVMGDNVGYWLGKKFGRSIFSKQGSFLLDPARIIAAERFYKKHGAKTIVLARFMPIVRTIAPVLAGVGSMHWRTFVFFNVIGALVWGVGLSLAGYILGAQVPGADHYILPIVITIVVVSAAPGLWHFFKDHRNRSAVIAQLRLIFKR
jgi:membrane-associated protein